MSMCVFLLPVAIAVFATASVQADYMRDCLINQTLEQTAPIPTKFSDHDLLLKTLVEFGAEVVEDSDGRIVATFEHGVITYEREDAEQAYSMVVSDIEDVDELVCSLETIEGEYDGNVQTYTYEKVLSELPEDMHLASEEVLEDNTIVLTLTID